MPSDPEKKVADPGEPPAIYIASCGVLSDIFWWARPKPSPSTIPPPAESQTP